MAERDTNWSLDKRRSQSDVGLIQADAIRSQRQKNAEAIIYWHSKSINSESDRETTIFRIEKKLNTKLICLPLDTENRTEFQSVIYWWRTSKNFISIQWQKLVTTNFFFHSLADFYFYAIRIFTLVWYVFKWETNTNKMRTASGE